MIYNDGVEMNGDLRVIVCPKCGNEQFSTDAQHCRICGVSTYNFCEGETVYDSFGNYEDTIIHKNYGNARFCEKCGNPTLFFK